MFARLYIEARLVNPEATDVVWEAWHSGAITTYKAAWAWWATTSRPEAVVEMIDYWQAADDPKATFTPRLRMCQIRLRIGLALELPVRRRRTIWIGIR